MARLSAHDTTSPRWVGSRFFDRGAAGSDVALIADKLAHLPLAIGLNIGPAVALHESSTLVVVFNALRLLVYKSEHQVGDSTWKVTTKYATRMTTKPTQRTASDAVDTSKSRV